MEGSECFGARGDSLRLAQDRPCDPEGFEDPVVEYGRDDGCSITGGYVYRGSRLPSLQGQYIFGDYCSGKVWAFSRQPGGAVRAVDKSDELLDTSHKISSFGEDNSGEIYIISLVGGIYTLTD